MLDRTADTIRGLVADAVERAGSGHPGMPLGCAEIGTVLYANFLKHDPEKPEWINRDRFVLSAGHGSMLLYSLLHLTGYEVTIDDLKNFKKLHSKTPGHPEYDITPGVDCSTGPLGQGIANAVGMAITERILADRYNKEGYGIFDHYTYTIVGDGCLMEGISSEAASLAGHLGLNKLIVFYDDNDITISGNTDLAFTEDAAARFKAFNWNVIEDVDGHDINEIEDAIKQAHKEKERPTMIIFKTHIAYKSPNKQDNCVAHGSPLGKEEIKGLKENLNIPGNKEFYVEEDIYSYFNKKRNAWKKNREKWEGLFEEWSKKYPLLRKELNDSLEYRLPENVEKEVLGLEIDSPVPGRKASGEILNYLADRINYLVGGSADVGGSTNTIMKKYDFIEKGNFGGRNIHFGIREHAMGAIVNGMCLHGGVRPFCSTYLVFSDYMRNSIRMAAMMKLPVIFIFSHDSIYVGGDGPTHQPVEQVESLRLIPNLKVIRPADEEETKVAWLEALKSKDRPTVLILSRQDLEYVNKQYGLENAFKGGYTVKDNDKYEVTLIASGSEVNFCYSISEMLERNGKKTRIVSVPDRKKFLKQDYNYIKETLGDKLRVIIEAGTPGGWYQIAGENSIVIGVENFGLSGDGKELAKLYGFDAVKITDKIMERLKDDNEN